MELPQLYGIPPATARGAVSSKLELTHSSTEHSMLSNICSSPNYPEKLTGLVFYRQSAGDLLRPGRFRVQTSVGARINLLLQTSPEVHLTPSTNGHLASFQGIDWPGRGYEHSLTSSPEEENE